MRSFIIESKTFQIKSFYFRWISQRYSSLLWLFSPLLCLFIKATLDFKGWNLNSNKSIFNLLLFYSYCQLLIPPVSNIYINHIRSNIIYTVKLILNFCTIEIIWSNFSNFLFPSPPWGTGRLNLKKLIIWVQILQKFEKHFTI